MSSKFKDAIIVQLIRDYIQEHAADGRWETDNARRQSTSGHNYEFFVDGKKKIFADESKPFEGGDKMYAVRFDIPGSSGLVELPNGEEGSEDLAKSIYRFVKKEYDNQNGILARFTRFIKMPSAKERVNKR